MNPDSEIALTAVIALVNRLGGEVTLTDREIDEARQCGVATWRNFADHSVTVKTYGTGLVND